MLNGLAPSSRRRRAAPLLALLALALLAPTPIEAARRATAPRASRWSSPRPVQHPRAPAGEARLPAGDYDQLKALLLRTVAKFPSDRFCVVIFGRSPTKLYSISRDAFLLDDPQSGDVGPLFSHMPISGLGSNSGTSAGPAEDHYPGYFAELERQLPADVLRGERALVLFDWVIEGQSVRNFAKIVKAYWKEKGVKGGKVVLSGVWHYGARKPPAGFDVVGTQTEFPVVAVSDGNYVADFGERRFDTATRSFPDPTDNPKHVPFRKALRASLGDDALFAADLARAFPGLIGRPIGHAVPVRHWRALTRSFDPAKPVVAVWDHDDTLVPSWKLTSGPATTMGDKMRRLLTQASNRHDTRFVLISGSPLSKLETFYQGVKADLYGSFGMQYRVNGAMGEEPVARAARPAIKQLAGRARALADRHGVSRDIVRAKDTSISFHRGTLDEGVWHAFRTDLLAMLGPDSKLEAHSKGESVEVVPKGIGDKVGALKAWLVKQYGVDWQNKINLVYVGDSGGEGGGDEGAFRYVTEHGGTAVLVRHGGEHGNTTARAYARDLRDVESLVGWLARRQGAK